MPEAMLSPAPRALWPHRRGAGEGVGGRGVDGWHPLQMSLTLVVESRAAAKAREQGQRTGTGCLFEHRCVLSLGLGGPPAGRRAKPTPVSGNRIQHAFCRRFQVKASPNFHSRCQQPGFAFHRQGCLAAPGNWERTGQPSRQDSPSQDHKPTCGRGAAGLRGLSGTGRRRRSRVLVLLGLSPRHPSASTGRARGHTCPGPGPSGAAASSCRHLGKCQQMALIF